MRMSRIIQCCYGAPFWSETDVTGTYSTNHGVNQDRELCTPVVLIDIILFFFSEICEQAPSLSHPEVEKARFYNLPIGSTAHPPWVGAVWVVKSRYASAGIRTSDAVVARPTPMRKVQGSSPVREKDFRVRMRRPKYLGLVTLTSFGWDDKPRSSVCTHLEHQARTIKILQSLCISHNIVETYRNQHAQCILSDLCH
jgi:hypothetical protein